MSSEAGKYCQIFPQKQAFIEIYANHWIHNKCMIMQVMHPEFTDDATACLYKVEKGHNSIKAQ